MKRKKKNVFCICVFFLELKLYFTFVKFMCFSSSSSTVGNKEATRSILNDVNDINDKINDFFFSTFHSISWIGNWGEISILRSKKFWDAPLSFVLQWKSRFHEIQTGDFQNLYWYSFKEIQVTILFFSFLLISPLLSPQQRCIQIIIIKKEG